LVRRRGIAHAAKGELIAEAHGDSCDLYGVDAHRRLLEWCEKLSYMLERGGMLPAAR
jgi:hypothetical protein